MNYKNHILGLLAVVLLGSMMAFSHYSKEAKAEKEVIALVESAYINGAFNAQDTKAMKNGFHEDFAIFSAKGETISRYDIADWIAGIEKRKAKADYEMQVWEHKLPSVDVTGGSAAVKVELFKDGKHVYTDYLSLLQFDSGWKIVAKVYHKHADS